MNKHVEYQSLTFLQSVLENITAEFARVSTGPKCACTTMTLFATVMLLLNLAGLTEVRYFDADLMDFKY